MQESNALLNFGDFVMNAVDEQLQSKVVVVFIQLLVHHLLELLVAVEQLQQKVDLVLQLIVPQKLH